MKPLLYAMLTWISTWLRSRRSMQFEIVVLRHQLAVYRRAAQRSPLQPGDRVLWSWLSQVWSDWRSALVFVQARTVIVWQGKRFRTHWAQLIQAGKPGRPSVSKDVRDLIRRLSSSNPIWGSPRIVGELHKLGIEIAKSTVEKYRVRTPTPPSPTWKSFLNNHVKDLVSIDFFTVPTVTFKVLFVFVILAHERRRVVHFNITEHPAAQWTAQQIIEAFPFDEAPRYLIRDRDAIYAGYFQRRIQTMGIEEVPTAPHSPWQSPYVERLIGSIRQECLDHVIVLGERHLKRILTDYFDYYHRWRTHRSLAMDCPQPRVIQPPELGNVVEMPDVGVVCITTMSEWQPKCTWPKISVLQVL